jgi:hypothetical protein
MRAVVVVVLLAWAAVAAWALPGPEVELALPSAEKCLASAGTGACVAVHKEAGRLAACLALPGAGNQPAESAPAQGARPEEGLLALRRPSYFSPAQLLHSEALVASAPPGARARHAPCINPTHQHDEPVSEGECHEPT